MKKSEINVGGYYTANVSGKLVIVRVDAIRLLVLFSQFRLDSPRLRPRRRIVQRDGVLDCRRPGAGEAFDEMQILAGAKEVGLGVEIRHVDDQVQKFPLIHAR